MQTSAGGRNAARFAVAFFYIAPAEPNFIERTRVALFVAYANAAPFWIWNAMYLINENAGGKRNLNLVRFNEIAFPFRRRILFKVAARRDRGTKSTAARVLCIYIYICTYI